MSDADLIREAAALMRRHVADLGAIETALPNGTPLTWRDQMAFMFEESTAAYIASWHPAVALAVADWLDVIALDVIARVLARGWVPTAQNAAALNVARTYLGRDA